jgi:hypothetical protein
MDRMFEALKLMLESQMAGENDHVVADEAGGEVGVIIVV